MRKIHRHHYIQACDCPNPHPITCAPVAPKLIAKGKYGVSVWSTILLDKYLGGTPTERLLQKLTDIGLRIAPGTIGDRLKKIAPLFEPIDAALLKQLRLQKHWHADETRWAMFVEMAGKIRHRWYLWVFHSAQVVHYVLDSSRASQVVIDEFEGVVCGHHQLLWMAFNKRVNLAARVAGCISYLRARGCWKEPEGRLQTPPGARRW